MKKQIVTLVVALGLFSSAAVQCAGGVGRVDAQKKKNTRAHAVASNKLTASATKLIELKQIEADDEQIANQEAVVEKEMSKVQRMLERVKDSTLTEKLLAGSLSLAAFAMAADVGYAYIQGTESYTGAGARAAGAYAGDVYTKYAPESVQKAGTWAGEQVRKGYNLLPSMPSWRSNTAPVGQGQ